jgi:hypothetical protein
MLVIFVLKKFILRAENEKLAKYLTMKISYFSNM